MKKLFSIILTLTLFLSSSITICAAERQTVTPPQDELISFETLQALFPDVSLNKNGYVDDYNNNSATFFTQKAADFLSNPVETHTAEYNGGICNLNVYANGAYGAYGFEKISSDVTPYDAGYNITGSTYRAYYTMMASQGFSYTFTVSSGSGYSTISQLSGVSTQYGIPQSYFSARSSQYIRAKQTSASAPAQVCGDAEYYHMEYSNGTFRLYSTANSGNVSVSYTVL